MEAASETVHKPDVSRFLGSFEPIFDSQLGGNIDSVYSPPIENRKAAKIIPKSDDTWFVDSLLSLTWYVEGKKVGKVRRYYPNGQLYALERYVEGVCHGEQEYYYLDGTLKTKIPYNRGCLEGEVLLYWPGGKLKRRSLYSQGEKLEEVFFDELQTALS